MINESPISKMTTENPVQVARDEMEVAMLVSEKCSQDGVDGAGTTSCRRVYSNGRQTQARTERSDEGDESKQQTVIEEYDRDDHLIYEKTIRRRIDYNYRNDQKTKEQELFDIISKPAGQKATRELTAFRYSLKTGKPKSMTWTRYRQIGNESRAGLVYHAALRYADDGSPERGSAEKWNQGKKITTYMNWNRISQGSPDRDPETWNQWESWIRNVSLQAYFP